MTSQVVNMTSLHSIVLNDVTFCYVIMSDIWDTQITEHPLGFLKANLNCFFTSIIISPPT